MKKKWSKPDGWKPARYGKGRNYHWIVAHVGYRFDDCLKWPFSRDSHGYGQAGYCGKVLKAHRVMCELVHGPAPGPEYEASHSCSRGHQGCINPRHISWKTRSANQRDRTDSYGKGTPKHKLTAENVAEIKSLLATTTNADLARRFDVTPGNISKIRNGKHWTGNNKTVYIHLEDEVVKEIKGLIGTISMAEIARRYNLPYHKVFRIKIGTAHGHVPFR